MNDLHRVEVRFTARKPWTPSSRRLVAWTRVALVQGGPTAKGRVRLVVSVHIVGARRSRALNARFRGKDEPTNVLSFAGAGQLPSGERDLGELIICAPVLAREAREQRKPPTAHWAHITIHGVLHLLGMDHQTARKARNMETLETQILETMGFSNPYG